MTKNQQIIINLINQGVKNKEIMARTGKSGDYIRRVRRRLMEDPQYFETRAIINKIQNDRPNPAKKDRSGRNECLRCERMFFAEDKRLNHICPRCSGERNGVVIESHMAEAHFSRVGRE